MKRCSISLVIRKRQRRTAARYRLTPPRKARMRKTDHSGCWRGGGQLEQSSTDRGWKAGQPLWEVKHTPALDPDPAARLLGSHPRETHAYVPQKWCTMFPAAPCNRADRAPPPWVVGRIRFAGECCYLGQHVASTERLYLPVSSSSRPTLSGRTCGN